MRKYILLPALLCLLAACSSDEQPTQSSQTTPSSQSSTSVTSDTRELAAHKIVFFLDPNGGPCRLQVSILNDMANELRGNIGIQYVQTTVPGDRDVLAFHVDPV